MWTPSADGVRDANLTRFMDAHDIDNLEALRTRAAEDVGWFWDADSWAWCFNTVLNGEKPILNYSGGPFAPPRHHR